MNIKLIIFLLFLGTTLFSQNLLNKKIITQIIKEGIKNEDGISVTWTACNKDSLYFKSDTISFYNGINQVPGCCQFIVWQIFKNKWIRRQESQTCQEPSSALVSSYYIFKYRIIKNEDKLFLNTYKEGKLLDSFLIIIIEDIKLPSGRIDGNKIILRRIRN